MTFWMFVSTVIVTLVWLAYPAAFLLALSWFREPLTALLWRFAEPPRLRQTAGKDQDSPPAA